jgi:hypothetical protein
VSVRTLSMKRLLFLLCAFAIAGCDDTKDLGDSSSSGGGSGHGPVKKNSHKMPIPHYNR